MPTFEQGAIVSLILAFCGAAAGWFVWKGRVTQEILDMSKAMEAAAAAAKERFDQHNRWHSDHFQHAMSDQAHFADRDLHTSPREKDEIVKKIDRMQEALDDMRGFLMNGKSGGA